MEQIHNDSIHSHPLVLVEGQQQNNEENEIVACNCSACGEVVLSTASRFSCGQCNNAHFHKECARAPVFTNYYPFHPQHMCCKLESEKWKTSEWMGSGLACALCKETLRKKMIFYKCWDMECTFSLDIKCSLTLFSENFSQGRCEFKDDGHQHPFIFLENHKDELKRVCCSWCHEQLKHSIYISSSNCQVILHKKCFDDLPSRIDHPCHRLHTLFFRFSKTESFCEVCQKLVDDNFFYGCLDCKFDIHIDCIWPTPIIEASKYHHGHPLNLFFKNDSFICNACGTIGRFVSYVCHTCHIQVHKNCTSLPPKIKVTRHDHVLLHKYYFLEKEGGGDCQICFQQVKAEYGSYRCSKEDCCNYVVHVKCALEDYKLYTIIDEENQDDDATDDSSITRVIKVNELGEAIEEVRHFKHDHNLVLEVMDEDDRACDGCMLPISTSTPFYSCSDKSCNFFLHKTCAELPKIKHHWFRRTPFDLDAHEYKPCYLCGRYCSGLFYCHKESTFMSFTTCLRCAAVPYTIKHEGHQHLLFFDHKCDGRCNACDRTHMHGAFRCKECSFTLDFHCMTYPPTVRHKCDVHLLKLTYHDDEDDDEQRYCDVCEKEKDPNRWYYSCSTCDNAVHSECALGRRPFLKDGANIEFLATTHHHSYFKYARKVDDLDYCSKCSKRCQDDALKCATTGCNFICHFDCTPFVPTCLSDFTLFKNS